MTNTMTINSDVTVGPQPTDEDLKRLEKQGFRSVVNFRTEGEKDQPLSPDQEGSIVRSLRMNYLHIPVSLKAMTREQVDEFRDAFVDLPKPVFAHCASGKRAGAMVMMHLAAKQNMTGDETLAKAEALGFECDHEELRQFVKDYIDHHARSESWYG